MSLADSLAPFYVDFGVPVTHTPAAGGASTTARAIHDLPGAVIYDGAVQTTEHSLRYPKASFPAVGKGDRFVIAGATFFAREPAQPILDGAECVVELGRV